MSDPNVRGDIAEAQVKLKLIQKDLQIYEPIRDSCRSDLVVEIDSDLYRVQIKSSHYKNGKVRFKTKSSTYHKKNDDIGETYHGDADVFAVYNHKLDAVYWIKVSEAPDSIMELRVEEAKQDDPRINWAEEYVLDRKI